jgi:hypothetical protein
VSKPTPLINVKTEEAFLSDERDIKAALIHVRRFSGTDPIKSWEEAGEVADAIKDLRLVVNAAEDQRKATNAPYEATRDHVNGHYKELLTQPNSAIAALKKKAVDFKAAKEAEERLDREAEDRAAEAQKAAELAAKEASEEAKRKAAEAHAAAAQAATATAAPPSPPKQVRGSFGAIGTRTDYTFAVSDATAVPSEFLMVNEKAIKAAIKGERAMAKAKERSFNLELIPGVTITPKEIEVSR